MVGGPYMITLLNWTLTFEWYMARLVITYGHYRDMCYDEVEYVLKSVDIILGSIVNTVGRVSDRLKRSGILTWTLNSKT
jgi:hypothetical protein